MLVKCTLSSVQLCQFGAVVAGAGIVETDKTDFLVVMQIMDSVIQLGDVADVAHEAVVVFLGYECTAGQLPVAIEVDGEIVTGAEAVCGAGKYFRFEVLINLLQGTAGVRLGQMPVSKPEIMAVKVFEQEIAEFFTQTVAMGK